MTTEVSIRDHDGCVNVDEVKDYFDRMFDGFNGSSISVACSPAAKARRIIINHEIKQRMLPNMTVDDAIDVIKRIHPKFHPEDEAKYLTRKNMCRQFDCFLKNRQAERAAELKAEAENN